MLQTDFYNQLVQFGKKCREDFGINYGICKNEQKIYFPELRVACESNTCSVYGKCHTCPPDIGTAEDCINKALQYKTIFVFQKTFTIEDSYDYYGMLAAKEQFSTIQHSIANMAKSNFEEIMVLGAGGCNFCKQCTKAEHLPCRFPDKALSSLEAHCIQVSLLAELSGLKYTNGQNTITYFGAVFFKK